MKAPGAPRKLTVDDIHFIREAVRQRDDLRKRASRLSNRALAKRFGVHHRTVEKVVQGNSWLWVRDET